MKLTMLIYLCTLAAGGGPTPDPVERSMHFVDQSLKATELFNADKPAQALPLFQDLLTHDADLDQDGYVALSVGDCLAALNRLDDARRAYQHAAKLHPDRQAEIEQRLTELALKGTITDDLLNRLRAAVKTQPQDPFKAKFQLTRALIKKTIQLLTEAAELKLQGNGSMASNLPAILNELILDLKSLTDPLDLELGRPLTRTAEKTAIPEPTLAKPHWQWESAMPNKPAIKFEITADKDGKTQLSANGKRLNLTPAQECTLRLHQRRINAILLEAAGKSNSKTK